MNNTDIEIENILEEEQKRQRNSAVFIASENYASSSVRKYTSSILTNKYAEGYPGQRYYAGCEYADQAENLAIDRGKKIFESQHINVQPHSGSQANMAVYIGLLNPGDKILSLSLDHGGHLSHGHNVNFSGKIYEIQSGGLTATYRLYITHTRVIKWRKQSLCYFDSFKFYDDSIFSSYSS